MDTDRYYNGPLSTNPDFISGQPQQQQFSKPFLSNATNRSALGGNKFAANKDSNVNNISGSGPSGLNYASGYQGSGNKGYGGSGALSTNVSTRNISGINPVVGGGGGIDGGFYNVPLEQGNFGRYKF